MKPTQRAHHSRLYFKVVAGGKGNHRKKDGAAWHSQPAGLFTENGGRRVCGAGGYVRLQSPGVPAAKLRQ